MTSENTITVSSTSASRQSRRERLFQWAIIVFFFLLPLQTRYFIRASPLYEWGTISVFLVEMLGWVVIALFCMETWKHGNMETKLNKCFLFLVSCFLTITFLSIAWAPDRAVAAQGAVRLLEGVLLYFVISHFIRNWKLSPFGRSPAGGEIRNYIMWAFLAGAALQAGLGIFQFLTQSSFASTLLGMALHDPRALGTSVVQFSDERWLRAYGGLPHPNVFGGYLVVTLAIILEMVKKGKMVKRGKMVALVLIPILLTGIFFSFSRVAWVTGIGLLSYWVIKLLKRGTGPFFTRKKSDLSLFFLIVLYLGVLVYLFRPLVSARFAPRSTERLEVKARVERVAGMREAWELIKHHPVLGVGIGNYTQTVARELRPNQPLYTYQPVHSVPLLVWAELGLAGLALFIAALYCIFIQSKPNALMFLCFIVLMTFDHYLWSLPLGVLLFWSTLGVAQGFSFEKSGLKA